MESSGTLESIAEVGVALAGFGGIAAGLGYRARGIWSPDDQSRLILLATSGLTVVFACYLPSTAHHLGSAAPWRAASALYFPFASSWLLGTAWFFRHGAPTGHSRIAALLVMLSLFGASGILLAAALGWGASRVSGLYLCAVLLGLFQSSIYFVRLLLTSFRTGTPAA